MVLVGIALALIAISIGGGWYGAAHNALLPPLLVTILAVLMIWIDSKTPKAAAYGQFSIPAVVMIILTWVSYFIASLIY